MKRKGHLAVNVLLFDAAFLRREVGQAPRCELVDNQVKSLWRSVDDDMTGYEGVIRNHCVVDDVGKRVPGERDVKCPNKRAS